MTWIDCRTRAVFFFNVFYIAICWQEVDVVNDVVGVKVNPDVTGTKSFLQISHVEDYG